MRKKDLKNLNWGDKLIPTKRAIFKGIIKPHDWGIFLGIDRDGSPRIVKVGTKMPYSYNPAYWDKKP